MGITLRQLVDEEPRIREIAKRNQFVDDHHGLRMWTSMPDPPPVIDRTHEQFRADNDWGMPVGQPQWVRDAHDTHKGERIFILGSGPSLSTQTALLPRLADEATWTVNRMARFKDLGFTPSFHSIAEPGPIFQWGRRIHPQYDFPEARVRIAIHWFPVTAPGWLWCAKAPDDIQVRWQGCHGMDDRLPPLPSAWASPLTVTQLALWMGFTEVFLLGCDTTQGGQAWDVQGGTTRFPRSIISILESADRIRCEVERHGRRIYDCTPGGRMNQEGILPYRDLAEVLG